MCNACGFYCCAYDGFERCGCDHCPEPACWDIEEDDFEDEDDYDFACCPRPTGFACVEVRAASPEQPSEAGE